MIKLFPCGLQVFQRLSVLSSPALPLYACEGTRKRSVVRSEPMGLRMKKMQVAVLAEAMERAVFVLLYNKPPVCDDEKPCQFRREAGRMTARGKPEEIMALSPKPC